MSNAILIFFAAFFFRVAQGAYRDPSGISTEFGETLGFAWLFAALFIRNTVVEPVSKRIVSKRMGPKRMASRQSSRRDIPASVFLLAAGCSLIGIAAYFLHAHKTTLLGFALACCAAAPQIGFGIWYGRRVHAPTSEPTP